MNTEITEIVRGWVFYDAECRFCRGWAERTRNLLLCRGYHLVPLQAPWVKARLDQAVRSDTSVSRRRRGNESQIFQEAANKIETPHVVSYLSDGLPEHGEPLSEMKLLTADGLILGGADAVIHLTRAIWWAWPVFVLAQIPGIRPLMRLIYRSIAQNRHCLNNHCPVPGSCARHHRHLTSSFYEFP